MGLRPRIARLLKGRGPETGEPVSDAELLARFAATRDPAAFELLVWRHGAMVLGVCRRAVRDEHLAEDAFQAVYLILARKAGAVRGANLAGWLFRVARRVGLRARKQAASRRARETTLRADPPAPAASDGAELAAVIDVELARLPERLRLPVLLCYLNGTSTEDAARLLGCPRGTILSRLAAARQRLADRLLRRGITAPALGLVLAAETGPLAALVPDAVRAAGRFLCPHATANETTPTSFLLAEGVLRAMTTTKLIAAGAAVLLAVGLVSGIALSAGQPGAPQPKTTQLPPKPGADPTKSPVPPPPRPEDDQAKAADEQIKKLERIIDTLRSELIQRETAVRRMSEASAGNLSPGQLQRKLRLLERSQTGERDLALDEVRRHANRVFQLRAEAEDPRTPNPPSDDAIKKAEANLAKAREELRKLDESHAGAIAAVERSIAEALAAERAAEVAYREIERMREEVGRLERRLLELRVGREGVPTPATGGTEATLDTILREVRELRREVRELKKP